MKGPRVESGWVGRRGVECLLAAESNIAYRHEHVVGELHVRRSHQPAVAFSGPLKVEIALLYESFLGIAWYGPTSIAASHQLGTIDLPLGDDPRILPFKLPVTSDAHAQPGFLAARIRSGPLPWNVVAAPKFAMRIGLDRTAEELIRDLAELAEARAQVWATSGSGTMRARFWPTRTGARYQSLKLEVHVALGRARGALQVLTGQGPGESYRVDLNLADRREYRTALWNCLARHLDLSGQLPIPVAHFETEVEFLPTPAGKLWTGDE